MILLIAFTFLLVFAEAGSAHYLWVESPLQVEQEDNYGYKVFWGHLQDDISERSVTEVDIHKLEEPGLLSGLDYRNEENYLQGEVETEKSGVNQILAVRPASVYQFSLNQFTAKTINVYGEPHEENISPAGLPLEINLLNSPEEITAGENLSLQVTYRGRPLPETDVTVRSKAEPEEEEVFTADKEGRVEVGNPLNEPVLFKVEHTREISGEKDGYEYDEIGLYHSLFLGL